MGWSLRPAKMQHFILPLLLLSAHPAFGHKRWQRISPRNLEGADYQGGDHQYHQGGGNEYTGHQDVASYGAGYTNDYDGQIVSNYNNAVNNYNDAGGNGYGGEQQVSNGDYGVHSTSYSASGYGQINGGAYENGGFGGGGGEEEGTGYGNEGWDKQVKTVVKTVVKNIAVPHPVPSPVHVPVPKYVKYFKPLHIAKPVAVPHVIPVIKHIQKPMPFFAHFPVRQSVPVPRFVGLPVPVRVPRPVFIAVPKIVPVRKNVPVAVPVRVPRPYVVPVYKQVPVPVPHKVPKIINVIKEVPHYVKKPVPVYVDDHPSVSHQGGHTLTSSTYSNHYGNSDAFDSFGGFGGNEDLYGGSHSSLGFGNDYGQQDTQNSLIFNSPFLFGKQSMQMLQQNFQQQQHQNLQVPSMSYPRAHRNPAKDSGYQQQQLGFFNYTSNPGPSYAYDVNGNLATTSATGSNYNQGQASTFAEMLMQQNNNNKGSNPLSEANKLANMPPLKVPLENLNSQFSQPIFNPSSYADFAANQQQQAQFNNYSQPYSEQTSVQISETPAQTTMEAQDSNLQYFNQHPGNSYSTGFNYQNHGSNKLHSSSKYGKQQQYSGNSFDYNNNGAFGNNNNAKFNQENPYNVHNTFTTSSQDYQSPWPSSSFAQNMNNNVMPQMQPYNQQQVSYPQQSSSSQNNLGYSNQGYNNYGANPTSYGGGQESFQQTTYRHTGNNNPQESSYQQTAFADGNFNNYIPSGQSSSSSSFSESSSPHDQQFQSSVTSNSFVKQNEKFDQGSYASDQSISPPAASNPGQTYGNSYGNSYGQNYGHQAQMRNTAPNQLGNQLNAHNQLNNYPSQFGAATAYNQFGDQGKFGGNPGGQFGDGHQYGNLNQFSQYADQSNQQFSGSTQPVPNQFNAESSQLLGSQSQASHEPAYRNSPSVPDQAPFDSQMNSQDPFTSSGSSGSFSPPTTSSNSYSSSGGDFSPPVDKSYLLPSSGFSPVVINSTTTQERSSGPITKSYSYSYTEKSGKKPSKLPEYMLAGKPEDQSPIVYSPQVDLPPELQSTNSKLDEMEEHIQSSASSIINFYTNSPESMGKGGTFSSFVDSDPLSSSGSSRSVSFFQPQDSEASSQYSSEDMKVVAGPSFLSSRDPSEPLQTSLDAYVPLVQQPVYQPQNDQNTVYKEATSEADDVYKEAVSLEPNPEQSSKKS